MFHRSRARLAGVLAAGLLLVAAGCAMPDNSPDGYSDELVESYLEGCTGDIPATDGTTTTLASSGYCECTYEVFRANVPFDDDDREERTDADGQAVFADYPEDAPTFRELNSELSDEPSAAPLGDLPDEVNEQLEECAEEEAPRGGGPTTTAPDDEDADEDDADGDTDDEDNDAGDDDEDNDGDAGGDDE